MKNSEKTIDIKFDLRNAVAENNFAKVRELLDRRNHDITNYTGKTSLSYAVEIGCFEAVTYLLDKGVNVNSADFLGKTPLMYAVASNHLDSFKALLNKGADVNSADFLGKTPLMYAKEQGNIAMVDLLLEKGADIDAKDRLGNQASDMTKAYNTIKKPNQLDSFKPKSPFVRANSYSAKLATRPAAAVLPKTPSHHERIKAATHYTSLTKI